MVGFKKEFFTISSEQERKSEALSFTTSQFQRVQPSQLSQMEARLITPTLRLHRTKFTDSSDKKQQQAQQEKADYIVLIRQTSLKGGAQIKKE